MGLFFGDKNKHVINMPPECIELLQVVSRYSGSSSSNERELCDGALYKLGEYGCRKALMIIIEAYSDSSDSHKTELSKIALSLL